MYSGPFEICPVRRGIFRVTQNENLCGYVHGDFLSCFYDDSLQVLFASYVNMGHLAMQAFPAEGSPATQDSLQQFVGLISQIDFCTKRDCSVIALDDGITVIDSDQNQYLLYKILNDDKDRIHVVPFSDSEIEFICEKEIPVVMETRTDWTWIRDASFDTETRTSLFSHEQAFPEVLQKVIKSYIDSGEADPHEVFKTLAVNFEKNRVSVYVFPRLEFTALVQGDRVELIPAAFVSMTSDGKGNWYARTEEELYHLEWNPFKCELVIPAIGMEIVNRSIITNRGIELPFGPGITEIVKDITVYPNDLEVYFKSGMKATVQEKAYPVRCLLSYYL